jgi:dTMP kinase
MFISFEGIDGSGKTTQIKMLEEYLSSEKIEFISLREPGGTEFSELIREILLSKKNKLNGISELFLFEAARSDLTEKVIVPALEAGKVVLCDRFYDSTFAYQGFGRKIDLEAIKNCNFLAAHGYTTSVTFYLSIDMSLSKERTQGKELDRMESSGDEFFKRVIEGFEFLAETEPGRFIKLDGRANKNEIHRKILDIVNSRLNHTTVKKISK